MDKYKIAIRALNNHICDGINNTNKCGYQIYLVGAFYMLCVMLKNDNNISIKQMLEIFDYFDSFFEKYF